MNVLAEQLVEAMSVRGDTLDNGKPRFFGNGRNIVPRMLPARLIERNLRRMYSYAA